MRSSNPRPSDKDMRFKGVGVAFIWLSLNFNLVVSGVPWGYQNKQIRSFLYFTLCLRRQQQLIVITAIMQLKRDLLKCPETLEPMTFNHWVTGSNPVPLTIFLIYSKKINFLSTSN